MEITLFISFILHNKQWTFEKVTYSRSNNKSGLILNQDLLEPRSWMLTYKMLRHCCIVILIDILCSCIKSLKKKKTEIPLPREYKHILISECCYFFFPPEYKLSQRSSVLIVWLWWTYLLARKKSRKQNFLTCHL